MSLTDGESWWDENQARARRLIAGCLLAAFVLAAILFYSDIQALFSSHAWWQDAIALVAGIAVPVLAGFELYHSGEANELRRQANRHRDTANRLQARVAELEQEKAGHLKQIAANTQRPQTQADLNAGIFRKHLRARVTVSEGKGMWSDAPEIVDVNNNIATLFCPRNSSSMAWCVQVHCNDVEIADIADGDRPLRVKINKRHGPDVQLGEIRNWEDRHLPAPTLAFDKGGIVYQANFNKQGSSDTRSLRIFAARDGRNSFLLEAGDGTTTTADNVGIAKLFASLEIDYREQGFERSNWGTGGGSAYPIFIR